VPHAVPLFGVGRAFQGGADLAQAVGAEVGRGPFETVRRHSDSLPIPGGDPGRQVRQECLAGGREVVHQLTEESWMTGVETAQLRDHRRLQVGLLRACVAGRRHGRRAASQPALQRAVERFPPQRLAQIVVHPGGQATLPLTSHSMRRQGHDRHVPDLRHADGGRGLIAIDTRQLAIHENQVVGRRLRGLDGLLAILRRGHVAARCCSI